MRLLLILLLIGNTAHAGKLWDLICRRINRENSPTSWYDNTLRETLRQRHVEYLSGRAKAPKPEFIQVGGVQYSVAQALGDGSEGTVYLVTSPQGASYAAKVFNNELLMDQFQTSLERRRSIGTRVPGIYGVSLQPPILLMEYARGIPVNEVLADPNLSAREKNRIRREFDRQILRLQPRDDINTILDIETGEFTLIDPT